MKTLSGTSIVKALPMPAVFLGEDERVSVMNESASALLGSAETGRHYITVLRQPAALDAIERCFETGTQQVTTYLTGQDQRQNTWQLSVSAVKDDADQRGVLLIFTDLSAIEEASQMRRDFVSNVSHELRTPLTAVLGFIETLRGAARDDPAARDRFLAVIDREARRMARLVDDLLSLSRVQDTERRRPTEQVDVAPLLQSVVLALQPAAEAEQVQITTALPDSRVVVPGDRAQLHQVISNLIENAIKYGGPGKTVEVILTSAQPDPSIRAEAIRLMVKDQGDGIPEHQIPRLTERFYRLDSHRSRDVGGTGLGLAIVKHILTRHKGRLRIASTPGEGSTFTVILPVS